ncbi:MAG: glycosyltransferase family 4 protein [bacterium]
MRILLVNQHYPPDGGATGRLLADLAEGLAARGHDVTVLTGRPTYPSPSEPAAPGHERLRGVDVVRVPMAPRREGALGRGLHYLSFAVASTWRGFLVPRTDAVVAFSSTPVFGGLSALLLARAKRCPLVYCVQDVHPEMAAALGALRSRAVVGLLRRLEGLAWRGAARLVVIGDDLRSAAADRGVDARRVVTIRNWADTSRIVPQERSAFRRELGLGDEHFVVQYAGNLGRAQDLDTVVAASELAHRADDRVRLMLVGGGCAAANLARTAEVARGVVVAELQPEERVGDVLAAADVSLVPLREGLARWCVPSKVYSILASGRPVGAVVDAGSEVARVVEEAHCGFRVDPGDVASLAREILRLSSDRGATRRLGGNGRAWLETDGALRRALDQYEATLVEVVAGSSQAAPRPT